MPFDIPQRRQAIRQIQTTKRNIPIEQIIAVQGASPIGTGIETAGNLVGQALQQRAALRRQGEQLAQLEALSGQDPGAYASLDPSMAASFATQGIKQKTDIQEEARKMAQNTQKVRALEAQFGKELGYKPGELGDDHPSALLKVQNDLNAHRAESGPAASRAASIEKNRYRNYLLDMEQRDPVIKEVNKQGLSLAAVDALTGLVEGGNTTAFSALGLKMAKGMGEVGVMTDKDIVRYVNSKMISQKAADTLLSWSRGRPTNATMGEIKEITDAMKTAFKERAQPRFDQYINSYSAIENITPEEFAAKLSLNYGGNNANTLKKIGDKSTPLPTNTPARKSLAEKLGL